MHKAQELFGYLDSKVMDEIAVLMGIPTAHIWGAATFYHYFNLTPTGTHTIYVCLGTACFVKGAQGVLDAIKSELDIDINGTTEDGIFTLRQTRCLGACGLAPVVMIDDKMYGQLSPDKIIDILKSYRKNSRIKNGAAA